MAASQDIWKLRMVEKWCRKGAMGAKNEKKRNTEWWWWLVGSPKCIPLLGPVGYTPSVIFVMWFCGIVVVGLCCDIVGILNSSEWPRSLQVLSFVSFPFCLNNLFTFIGIFTHNSFISSSASCARLHRSIDLILLLLPRRECSLFSAVRFPEYATSDCDKDANFCWFANGRWSLWQSAELLFGA